MTTVAAALRISLEVDCVGSELCERTATPLLEQLSSGDYDRCSVLGIPDDLEFWLEQHRTARKRAIRSGRRGYIAGVLEREKHADEIHRINTSARFRQGRPMSRGYRERQTYSPLPDYPCPRHAIRTTGISFAGELVGYVTMYRCGELALVSQILGHVDYLEDEIMYQLFAAALRREIGRGNGICVYNRHDSGTPGLVFFKERLGFEEAEVEWAR